MAPELLPDDDIERGRSDVIERRVNGDAQHLAAVEHERSPQALGVAVQLLDRVGAATRDDDLGRDGSLGTDMGAQVGNSVHISTSRTIDAVPANAG